MNFYCERCGKCCLSSPCWLVDGLDAVFFIFRFEKIHLCPWLVLRHGVALCRRYRDIPEQLRDGRCTNHHRNDFTIPIRDIERYLIEKGIAPWQCMLIGPDFSHREVEQWREQVASTAIDGLICGRIAKLSSS